MPIVRLKHLAIVVLIFTSPSLAADAFTPSLQGKKLISYGMDWPNTAYVRAHIGEMEKHPFDGIVIGVSAETIPQLSGPTMGNVAWNRKAFDAKDFEHAIDDLKATHFSKFTDNFIQVEAMPGDVDWFDDAQWASIIANFRTLARIAKQGGCVGLEFDPEQYGSEHVFTPLAWSEATRNGRGEAQYRAKAIERGKQLMRAINGEFPGIRILCLFGPSLSMTGYVSNDRHDYELLDSLLYGMCQVADVGTEITDGFEQSYGYRVEPAFASGRESILRASDRYKRPFNDVMRVGFGLWTDNDSGHRGWWPDQPEKNLFQPATWQNAVHFGLAYSDRYVWVWREKIHEWENKDVGEAYEEAQRVARTTAAHVEVIRKPMPLNGGKRQTNDEERGFGAALGSWLKDNRVLVDLTTAGWMFRTDPEKRGVDDKWFTANAKAPDWSPIEIGKYWEEQGWDYDGYGWYRRTISLADVPKGKVQLAFGACDESADIYLNGERVGGQDIGEFGWDRPFSVDLTGKLHAGANELAVRVLDRTGPGGIWKAAAVFQAHEFSTVGKKLIEYGWDCPSTAYVREHVREMERRPFNGVVIQAFAKAQAGKRARSLGDAFSRQRFNPAEVQKCVEDLAATRFEKFTDNFIAVLSQPGDVDFFDADWDSVTANVRSIARIARAGHCAGLMLDPEMYGAHKIWSYGSLPAELRAAHSLEEYRAKARQRGDEFIRAVNSELPNAKILCLFGPALTFGEQRGGEDGYNLLAPFLEGACSGGDAGTRVIDGFEQSYMYRTKTSFLEGRKDNQLARSTFADSTAFDRGMRVGFGLWMDNDSKKRPWDTQEFANNLFQPDTWQDAIHYSLCASDEYVWVYVERLNWWSGKDLPDAYVTAQIAGREKAADTFSPHPSRVPSKFIKHAPATRQVASPDLLLDLTSGDWLFRVDPDESGVGERWFGKVDDAKWSKIAVGKFCEEQDWDYDGYAWYRKRFTMSEPPLRDVEVRFGACDESARVWLNGNLLGEHDLGEYGWDKPFSLNATGMLRDGENELVVRVLDRAGPGGIWKPVGVFRKPQH